jgi:predicted transcriptional regulator
LAQDDVQEKNCIIGAVKDFISYFHGDTQAAALCATLPVRFKSECESTRISYEKTL